MYQGSAAFDIAQAAPSDVEGGGVNAPGSENGAGNGIRTRDFDLGKVALYH